MTARESPVSEKDPVFAVLQSQVIRAFVKVPSYKSAKHPARVESDLGQVHRVNMIASATRSVLDKKPSSPSAHINAKQLLLWCLPSAVTASVCLMIPCRQNGRLFALGPREKPVPLPRVG